jgi:hypothetical protein
MINLPTKETEKFKLLLIGKLDKTFFNNDFRKSEK